MALTISTGFVVDDAIVMIENIARYLEQGETPLRAALRGSEQIGFTIVSLTVSLIAVLIPLLFMGDIVGRLFREFAITLGRHDFGFGFRFAHADAHDVRQAFEAQTGSTSKVGSIASRNTRSIGSFAKYANTLKMVLRHQTVTLFVTAATLGRHHFSLHHRAQRLLPGARYRRHFGSFRSSA